MISTSPDVHASPSSADQLLWENQARLRQLIHAADVGLWDWDLVTNAVYFSPEWKQQLGYADHELPNLFEEWEQRLHPEDLERTLAAARDYRAGCRAVYDLEFRMRHRDGTWRWMFARADFLRDSNGQPVRMMGCHFDVTARKHAEEAQRVTSERIKYALDATRDGIWDWNIPTGEVFFSPQWARLLGYEPGEVPNQVGFFYTIVHPADVKRMKRVLDDHLAGRTPVKQNEVRLRMKSGEYRWFFDRGEVVVRDAAGSPRRMVGTITDITERKLAEAVLHETAERLREAQSIAQLGSFHWNAATDHVTWSDELFRIYGHVPGRFEPSFEGYVAAVHPSDRPRVLEALQTAMGTLGSFSHDYRAVLPDGSVRWVHARGRAVVGDDGKLAGLEGTCQDVTARRLAEEAQAEALGRLQKIAGRVPGVVYQYRLRPDGTACLPYASEGLREMYGVDPEEVRDDATKVFVRHHPDDLPGLAASIEKSARDLSPWSYEARLIADDGSVRWLAGNSLPEREADGSILWHGFIADITDRKLAEEALRSLSHRLVQAGEEERRRIARELHDSTAQDLVAVLMNLALLQEHLGARDIIASQIVADSTALLENSVTDIRTLAYLAHPPQLDETGLAGALTDYAHGFSQRTTIRVQMEIPPGLPRLPEPCEMALFRVVQESLANVHRHAQSENATIRLAQSNGAVILEIADTGRGFSLEKAARPGALGVGIPGMRERMQYCGGRLEVESGSGGTIIRAVVPQPAGAT
ncbi:MAG: PAS domain-containing protein [Chthoniobacter sp.]|nr:PAS domain-containing protein [Chthoniobacter sp.]